MTPRQRSNNGLASRVYVANFGSDTVSVIDTATNTVIHTISGVGPDANRGNKRHVGRRSDDRQRTSVFVLVLITDTLALLKSPT